jgi:pyridoxal phosphate enzyme (YggS family)
MLIGPQNLAVHVNHVRSRMHRAAEAAGRDPASVTLVAVSKTKPAELLEEAATAGVTDFGESYLQEAVSKMRALEGRPGLEGRALEWHFIGGLQSNKTRPVAERFQWVHSIDRIGIARRLSDQRPFHAPPLNLCIQVAVVPESTKGGIAPPQLADLAAEIAVLPRVRLRGLDVAAERSVFAALRGLQEQLNAAGHALDVLSMGMSGDFESAIAEGATHVRIGTALFGSR